MTDKKTVLVLAIVYFFGVLSGLGLATLIVILAG